MTGDCWEFRQCRLARMHIQRRRVLLTLAAGVGTAEVAATMGGARESYSTRHHESPRYIYGDGRKRAIVPASVANHTDSELILLESLVGRSPPQSFMDSPVRY